MTGLYDHGYRNGDSPELRSERRPPGRLPFCARVVADGAMDLTPSVSRQKSASGGESPESPPGGPRRIRANPDHRTSRECRRASTGPGSERRRPDPSAGFQRQGAVRNRICAAPIRPRCAMRFRARGRRTRRWTPVPPPFVVQPVRGDGATACGQRLVVWHVRGDGAAAWGQRLVVWHVRGEARRLALDLASGLRVVPPGRLYAAACAQPGLTSRSSGSDQEKHLRPRQDSNLRSRLRRAVLYPLSYGGPASGPRRTVSVVGGPSRTLDVPPIAPGSPSGHRPRAARSAWMRREVASGRRCAGGLRPDVAQESCPVSRPRAASRAPRQPPRSRCWPHPSGDSAL